MLPGNEVAEGGRLGTRVVAEDIAAAGIHHALVQVHRAALCARDRLGHKDCVHTVLNGDFLSRVLEQKSLVGHIHWVAVHQVNLVLGHADFVDPSVGVDAQGHQRRAELVPKRGQFVEHVQAEGGLADFGLTVAGGRGRERHGGVVVGRGQVKLDFRGDHRSQALGGVAGHYFCQQAARCKDAGLAVQLKAVVDGEGARCGAPGREFQRAVVGH